MTLVTEYAAIQKVKRLSSGIARMREEIRGDQTMHHHRTDDLPPDYCPGCELAERLNAILREATR